MALVRIIANLKSIIKYIAVHVLVLISHLLFTMVILLQLLIRFMELPRPSIVQTTCILKHWRKCYP